MHTHVKYMYREYIDLYTDTYIMYTYKYNIHAYTIYPDACV